MRDLQPLISPKSVAVVGVSRSGSGWGATSARRLRDFGFTGDIFTVGAPDIGLPVTAIDKFANLPAPADLLIVALPASVVPEVVREARDAGALRSALVFSAGFAELDHDGAEREQALREAPAPPDIVTIAVLNFLFIATLRCRATRRSPKDSSLSACTIPCFRQNASNMSGSPATAAV